MKLYPLHNSVVSYEKSTSAVSNPNVAFNIKLLNFCYQNTPGYLALVLLCLQEIQKQQKPFTGWHLLSKLKYVGNWVKEKQLNYLNIFLERPRFTHGTTLSNQIIQTLSLQHQSIYRLKHYSVRIKPSFPVSTFGKSIVY